MNIAKWIRNFCTEPWGISEIDMHVLSGVLPVIGSFMREKTFVLSAEALDAISDCENQNFVEKRTEIINGVAVVPICGTLAIGLDRWEKQYFGLIDYYDIRLTISNLLSNEDVGAIVLNISSPGGMVMGVKETAQLIKAAAGEKPIIAWTDQVMASAAYFISAGATAIYATETSTVGSIGTILSFMDVSGLYEKLGLKQEVFTGGKFKGIATPGTSLTEEQRSMLNKRIEFATNDFRTFVSEARKAVKPESMEGQIFWGAEAMAAGLVDSIADLDKAISDALSLSEMKL